MRACEICLRNQAKYVCERCGQLACEFCFNPHSWLCVKCEKEQVPLTIKQPSGFNLFKFIFLGFTLIFIGMLIMFLATLLTGLSSGFILFFGPIPFILSFGEKNVQTIIFAALIIATLVLMIFMLKKVWF